MGIRKYGLGGAVAAGVLFAATGALADPMMNFYDNTVKITYPDGSTATLKVEPDGSYSMVLPDGSAASGYWSLDGGKFCAERAKPEPQPKRCTPAAARAVGAKWTETMPEGVVRYELVAGR